MEVFVARQPIFTADREIYAYELLFRTGLHNAFPAVDGETATSSLLSSTFFTVGIDRISAGRKAFINFTAELLRNGTPAMFPPDKIVVEILEDVPVTEELLVACRQLVASGYELALDDFVYYRQVAPLVELAGIIKVDFQASSREQVEEILAAARPSGCRLLAEKVETYEEFREAEQLGFDYFQGYFFARPEVLQNRDISSSQLTVMQLICEINQGEFNIERIEKLVNQDVSISYKLMNYLNSAYFSRLQPVRSIRQALSFLGARGVRMFVSLVAAAKLAEDKPHELIKASIIRARFLEQLGEELGEEPSEFFILGLFSLLDAMLDESMATIVGKLPLTTRLREALVDHQGELAQYLELVEQYESCKWGCVASVLHTLNVNNDKILDFYLEALKLADSI